ncbi:MAG: rhamnogalacturonan acetylesterase [Paludibacter sp.]|nr:rhamnogalacturonan acetylesterase [Paludibacter sp.]
MKFKFLILFLLSVGILQAKVRVFTIGDSTMADYDTVKYSGDKEQRGWCQLFPELLTKDVILKNAARNGRSSKSFYYEVWKTLRNELKPGDYVFIQFGHNDEKNNGLDTNENDTTTSARGTAPWSEYQRFLSMYVKDVRERGAIPVLFTPVTRRYFKDGHLTQKALHNLSTNAADDSTLNYVAAMKHVAREFSVPLIDLTASTKRLVESYGPEKSKAILYIKADDTHLKIEGAREFAKLAAVELKSKGILSQYIVLK